MDLVGFLQNLYSRCFGLIRSPKKEWYRINEEQLTVGQLIFNYVFPLVLIVVVASMVGDYLNRDVASWTSQFFGVAAVRSFLIFAISFGASITALDALIRFYVGYPDVNLASKLVFFSFVPIMLSAIACSFMPDLLLAKLLSLYGAYLMFYGAQLVPGIPSNDRPIFRMASVILILAIYFPVNFVLSAFLGAIK
jgi:hypothetical protein